MKISFIIAWLIIIFFVSVVFAGLIWDINAETYTTLQITECNDADGDLIEGLVCYKKVECSTTLKFWNEDGCEEFVE